jgi:hypothetical protein
MWEWRQDQICMPGCTQSEDIRLRYISEVVNFSTPADVILIRGAQSAIASYLAGVFSDSRGGTMADKAMAMGDKFTLSICRRNTRARQSETITRHSYGGVKAHAK